MQTQERIASAPSFALLPDPPRRWRYLVTGLSYVAQVLILFALTKLPFSLFAPVLQPVEFRDSVHLVAPVLEPAPKKPEPVIEAKKVPAPKPIVAPKVAAKPPVVTPPPIEAPKVEVAKVTPPPVTAVTKPDTFRNPELASTGSSAPVTEHKPSRQVQTGGFGDPNGVPPNPNSTGKGPVIAKVGSFDLPAGPGTGNGTGGSKGTRGTVASAGFGNGVAGPGDGGSGSKGNGTVKTTNFGNAEPAPGETPKRQAATVSKDTPVAVLSKPTPSYTIEARQRKIEGDVELEVEFTASGQVRVLRVVQGLGYGLDESAVKAAEKITFAPARHDGQPVDSPGRLRIVFRLS